MWKCGFASSLLGVDCCLAELSPSGPSEQPGVTDKDRSRSSVWKLQVALLPKDEPETAACKRLIFPSQLPCLCHLHFQRHFLFFFFVPLTSGHISTPLCSANTDSFPYVIYSPSQVHILQTQSVYELWLRSIILQR